MSRQYPNRPFAPPRRRVSLPMCDFVPYSTPPTNETPPVNPPWRLTEPAPFLRQQQTVPSPPLQTDFSYFQFPPHRRPVESSLLSSTHEVNSGNPHFNEPHPPCHFHYSEADNEDEQQRPMRPLSLVTAAATTAASAPHHRHYRLESPSAASFTRQPPWFDDEWDENNGNMHRPSRRNSSHSKRQRSSAVSTPTDPQSSSSSQQYHHHPQHERKRSRHETNDDDHERSSHRQQENALQQQQQQYRPSSHFSHHHYQPYPSHRPTAQQQQQPQQQQPVTMPRTLFTDNVTPILRPFDQRPQQVQRNRIEHPHEMNNASVQYGSHHRTAPPPVYPRQNHQQYQHHQQQQQQPREQRQFVLEPPPAAPPRRQSTASGPHPPHGQHVHRNGMAFEQPHQLPQRGLVFHRPQPPIAPHIHQRPSPSFLLSDLLHRVIDAHAASYGDDHAHYHHHPPSASIDLIAYAWMTPGHEIFSLPAAFSIQFGDFFDLTMPDETPVVGLTDSELERLPTMTYSKPCATIDADDKCAVCLSEYISGERLKRLRCKHFFHSECIDPWLKTSTRCPICRGEQTC